MFFWSCSVEVDGRETATSEPGALSGTFELTPAAPPPLRVSVLLELVLVSVDGPDHLALGIELLLRQARRLGVDVGRHAHDRIAGADDLGKHGLDLLAKVVLHLLAVADLGGGGAEGRILLEVLRKDMAVVVDHGDLVGQEALDGIRNEVADRVDLVGLEPAPAEVDEDRGRRLDVLVGQEQPVFRLDDHHPGGAHALELRDRAAQFALDRPQVVRPLHKVAEAELALVEDLEPDAVPARKALGGEIHPELVDLVRGHLHRRAARRNLVRDVLRLEVADDSSRVLVAEPGVQQLVVGPARPEDDRGQAAGDGDRGDDQRHALVGAKLLPEGEEGQSEILHL